jgi:hypothetical protein
MTTDPYLATTLALGPDRAAGALAGFLEANPQQTGVDWATALDILDDTDSTMWIIEDLGDCPADVRSAIWSSVIRSLYWAATEPGPIDRAEVRRIALDAQAKTPDEILAWVQHGGWGR